MTVRILVTGSREFSDEDLLYDTLSEIYEELEDSEVIVIHGAARGADSFAGRWAHMMQEEFRVFEEKHPADWDSFGKAAGGLRNQAMIDLGADIVVAFRKADAKNIGTNDCIRRATSAGIEVRIFTQE